MKSLSSRCCRLLALAAAGVIGLLGWVGSASAAGAAKPVQNFPARWWAWAESAPAGRSPITDKTGRDCSEHQPADVWFLAGTTGGSATRSCTITTDRPIYFPVLNRVCPVTNGQLDSAALSQCVLSVYNAKATLDGKSLAVLPATSGTSFELTVPRGDAFGLPPGARRFVTWGAWVGPLRVSKGSHVLHFRARSGTFSLSVVYHLTVR